MKTKYYFLLIILVAILFFINGCKAQDKQTNTQKTAGEENAVQTTAPGQTAITPLPESSGDETLKIAPGVPLGPLAELGSHASPGRKATIVMKGQNGITEGVDVLFYLLENKKQTQIYQSELVWDEKKPVVWVDDNMVLLNNTWLYDRAKGTGKDLTPQGAGYVWASALNQDGTLLAMTGRSSISGDRFSIWIYDLTNGTTKEIFNYKGNSKWTSGISFDVSWDSEDNLFFDADFQGAPTVFRYNQRMKSPEVFIENAWLPAISPDGQHLAYHEGKSYYNNDAHTMIQDIKSGMEVDTGTGGGLYYWSPDGSYFAILDGKTINYFKIAQYDGENTSQVRQYTIMHPGYLSLIEFVDNSHMQMVESTETKGQINKTRVFVLGPDEQKDKVWVAARGYMEGKGRHVGLRIGDMVLFVRAIFDNRAVVIYGPYASEPSAEILLELNGDGNWRVDTDQPLYSTNNELSGEAMQALALQEGLDFGAEQGKMAIGVKEQGPGRFTFIVGKYGWPWSVEYDLEKADGAWNIAEKRDVK
ncbi:MAG: TolB family protein [Bacillota bacterium]